MTPRQRPPASPAGQRGMVTVVVMFFLIATVVFSLTQMLNMSTGNVAESQRQADRNAAFFLAESGLEKAQASLNGSLMSSAYTSATCTGVASNYSLGRGTVTLSAVSTPATCDNSGATPCGACTVTSVGQVGNGSSTLVQDMNLTSRNGVYCNGATTNCSNSPTLSWQLRLQNTATVAGIGLFALTYDEQGNNQASCAAASNCRLQMSVSSPAAGTNSVGLMGNAVLIPAGSTYPIYQTMTKGRNSLAEVGAFFLGNSAPTLTGPTTAAGAASYWNSNNNATAKTVGSNGSSTGGTNDGTATSGGTCSAPSASSQSCTSWCQGGDTLVFSFSANVTRLSDQLSDVTFGTNAGVGQNVAMTQIAKYPSPQVTGAPANVDAEIWYARNANFTGASPLAVNASSYKGRGTGAVGARWVSNNTDTTSINSGTLTVGASFTGWPGQVISVGDTVSWSGGGGTPTCPTNTSCGTIASQVTPLLANEQLGGRGRYVLNGGLNVPAANNRTWTVSSTVLRVSACTICNFAAGDALSGLVNGRSISSQAALDSGYGATEATGGIGRYTLSGTATFVASGSNLYAGTPGSTLYLPATSSQPTVTSPQMLIAVKTGTGALTPGTRVTAVSAPNPATTAFTVNNAPTTPLDNATLCAGTCAFFVPNATTNFALSGITGNFNNWAAGFTCLKGVDLDPAPVTSATTSTARWTEPVQ